MMDKCRSILPLLGPLADGELDEQQSRRVRLHVAECPECRRELAALDQLHALVRRHGPPELAEDFWDWQRQRVWRRLRADRPERQRFFRPSFVWPKLATLAGGLVVVLVVVLVGWQMLGPGLVKPRPEVAAEKKAGLDTSAQEPDLSQGGQGRAAAVEVAGRGTATRAASPAQTDVAASEEAGSRTIRDETEAKTAARVVQGEVIAGKSKADGIVTATVTEKQARTGATGDRDEEAAHADGGMSGDKSREPTQSPATVPSPGKPAPARMKSEVKEPERPAVVMLESPESEDPEHPDTGTALVTVQADSLGRVWSVRLARSSGFARLDSIALQTARQQKLGPRAQSGKRMPFTLQQFYQFRPGKKAQQKSDN